MSIRIGNAPCSWGVEFANDPRNPPWTRVLDQCRDAGYNGIELGPIGFMPEDYGAENQAKLRPVRHSLVSTHPVTGRKSLFVNRGFTTRIEGVKKHESDALLEMLYRHSETPEFQCRFAWQPNSIAFWDNRAAMHHAMWDYFPHKRLGYRVTVKGDKPFHHA